MPVRVKKTCQSKNQVPFGTGLDGTAAALGRLGLGQVVVPMSLSFGTERRC